MSNKVHFTTAAEQDLDEIAAYSLEHYGQAHRDVYMNRLEQELDSLNHYVRVSRRLEKLPELRCWYFSSHAIYFRQVADGVEVVRVLHKAQVPVRHLMLEALGELKPDNRNHIGIEGPPDDD